MTFISELGLKILKKPQKKKRLNLETTKTQ